MIHRTAMAALATLLLASQAAAEDAKPAPSNPDPNAPATQEQVKTLAEELRRLKLDIGIPDVEYRSFAGMGPAASKVYYQPKGLAIGGYGEFTFHSNLHDPPPDPRRTDDPVTSQTDLRRVVLYAGYRFSPKIVFNSEIEFEHAGKEVAVEFAYLDFLFTDALRLRVGNVLVPMGFINEMHEPPFFHGVDRPDVETFIIPATWSENGAGLHGELAGFRYKAYLLTGLDPIGQGGPDAEEPVTAQEWLRRARSGGAESRAESWAGVVSLAYEAGPATVGGAFYGGRAGQGETTDTGQPIHADVTLAELHGQLAWRGLQARVLLAQGTLGDADLVSEKLGLSGEQVIGSRVRGGYAEVAYDVLSLVGSEAQLWPFVRWERLNLHDQVPAGGVVNPALKYDLVTTGLTFKPIPTVVAKADFQWRQSDAPGGTTRAVNLGAGFVF
jgi:hypothetical protein